MDSLESHKQHNAYPKPALTLHLTEFQDHQQQHQPQQQHQQMQITDFQDITFDSVAEDRTSNTSHQFYDNQQQQQLLISQDSSIGSREANEKKSNNKIDLLEGNNNSSSPLTRECHSSSKYNQSDVTNRDTQETFDDRVEDNHQDEPNDEDEFVALCTDASLVLNNDQSRRYYTNELYQPMKNNSQQVEDEYLLYQELRFIEAQEPHSKEQGLTKILEDDDGDIDEDDPEHGHRQDAFDRLQLTNIIDAFGYPLSPLIDNCRSSSRDPLISGICETQDKPDSTGHGTVSPSDSSDSGAQCQISMQMNNHYMSSTNHPQNRHQGQFDCNSQDDRESHFLSDLNSDQANVNRVSHQHHLHQELATYNNQLCDQDNSSENCLKQVEPTFLCEPTNESDSSQTKPSSTMNCFENSDFLNNSNKTNIVANQDFREQERNERKRSLQEMVVSDDAARTKEEKTTPKSGKNRGKRKKVVSDELQTHQTKQAPVNIESPISNVTSSMLSVCEGSRNLSAIDTSNNFYKTNENQQKHITSEKNEDDSMTLDDEMSVVDDTASSSGGHRHPHMSKYRRRTANARERIRMREINQAFEKLKKVVPVELIQQSMSGDDSDHTSVSNRRGGSKSNSQQSDPHSVKLTKISTLRYATSYIALLGEVLSQHPEGSASTIIDRSSVSSTEISVDSRDETSARSKSSKPTEKVSAVVRKRRRRVPGPKPSVVADDTKKSRVSISNNKSDAESSKKTFNTSSVVGHQEPPTSQQRMQQQPVMFTSHNILQQSANNGCTSIQSQQMKQTHFAYPQCHQQPINIAQTSTADNQERTFITPVAVAILGIPNQGTVDQPQTLQLLGIQGAQQLQHRHHPQQQFQSSPVCNMITQQPQQVTLTLDEINGLSVLRLNNPQNTFGQGQQTIQLQPTRKLVQQPQILTATANQSASYNYAAYQPIHISQLQTSTNGITTVRPMNGQTSNAIHIEQQGNSSLSSDTSDTAGNDIRANTIHQPQITSDSHHHHQFIATAIAPSTKTNTGTNSDFRNHGISSNMIAQHLSTSSNNVQTIAHQIKFQQSNCSGQILANSKLMTVAPTSQLFQASVPPNGPSRGLIANQTTNSANLIYITPPTSILSNNNSEPALVQSDSSSPLQQQNQHLHLQEQKQVYIKNGQQQQATSQKEVKSATKVNGAIPNVHQFEQMKFVTQFSSQNNNQHRLQQPQDKAMHSSEANIRQLVATLTTSIHPSSGEQNKSCNLNEYNGEQQQVRQQQQQQQQQQQKRTYRFHNYDGNMITNHLYNSNHDKQQQTQGNKRCQQQQSGQQQIVDQANGAHQVHPSQRSRQNSLSSTCSTTSSASSSLASLPSSSPTVPIIPIMIKSPALESNSLPTSVTASDG